MFPLSASPPEIYCFIFTNIILFVQTFAPPPSKSLRLFSCAVALVYLSSEKYIHLYASIHVYIFLHPAALTFDFATTIQQDNPYFFFLRKEVIQPHLPIRLPCYDFTPVTEPAFGRSFLAVRSRTSGVSDSHGVTGGVYKTRERIHRSMLICDY